MMTWPCWPIPTGNWSGGIPDLAQSLQLLLKIDPVRAWLLGRQVRTASCCPRKCGNGNGVGFAAARGYDLLRQWLEEYSARPRSAHRFVLPAAFRRTGFPPAPGPGRFGGVPAADSIGLEVFATARRLAPGRPCGCGIYQHAVGGTVAADSLLEPATREKRGDPGYPLCVSGWAPLHPGAGLLDSTSRRWFQEDVREIINPHLLKSDWREDEIWDDACNESLIRQNGARLARALLRRCTDTLGRRRPT